jgi:hypothetical protein
VIERARDGGVKVLADAADLCGEVEIRNWVHLDKFRVLNQNSINSGDNMPLARE